MLNLANCRRGLILAVLGLSVTILLISGCGGDSAKPGPVLNVMGAILIDRTFPAGGPYQAAVVVSVDGQAVSDAVVSVNGTRLVYNPDPQHPEQNGFVGLVPLQTGQTATVSVSCAAGQRTLQTITPGPTQILTPPSGAGFEDDQDITVTWTPAAGAALCMVVCGSASMEAFVPWILPKTADTYSIPASFTSAPGNRISVISLSGSGSFPSTDLREWPGKDGFWVTSQDWVDVQVGSR